MALIAVAADKGAPGVTTTSVALAAVWPRPVLLAECDPAGGDLVYRLPSADGSRLDPRRGLLSLAVSARRGLEPRQVWEHAQKLRGGLDVLVGVTNAEQGAGLDPLWGQIGAALAGLPDADVIADCGRVGSEGRYYDLLARADAVVMITRASLGDMVRIRDRVSVVDAAVRRRTGAGRVSVLVIANYKSFSAALGEVKQVLSGGDWPAPILGGIAYEPRSAELLSGEWGGKLDKSLLIRTAREVAGELSGQLSTGLAAPRRRAARPAAGHAAVAHPAVGAAPQSAPRPAASGVGPALGGRARPSSPPRSGRARAAPRGARPAVGRRALAAAEVAHATAARPAAPPGQPPAPGQPPEPGHPTAEPAPAPVSPLHRLAPSPPTCPTSGLAPGHPARPGVSRRRCPRPGSTPPPPQARPAASPAPAAAAARAAPVRSPDQPGGHQSGVHQPGGRTPARPVPLRAVPQLPGPHRPGPSPGPDRSQAVPPQPPVAPAVRV